MDRTVTKKTISGYIALSTMFFILFTSCWNKTKTPENTVYFDTIRIDEKRSSLIAGSKASINCHLNIDFVYPNSYADVDVLQKMQSAFIERMFSVRYTGLSPKQATESFVKQYFSDFQSEKFSEEDYNLKDESTFHYHLDLKNVITYNDKNLVSFLVETEIFEGGAHGSHSACGYVFDLYTGEYITEESFAGTDYNKNLSDVIVRKIAEANKVNDPKQLENIGYNNIRDIVPNGNFTLDEKGITYYFNEYEIAAYFIGITKVFIPYDEFKIFITDDNPIALVAKL